MASRRPALRARSPLTAYRSPQSPGAARGPRGTRRHRLLPHLHRAAADQVPARRCGDPGNRCGFGNARPDGMPHEGARQRPGHPHRAHGRAAALPVAGGQPVTAGAALDRPAVRPGAAHARDHPPARGTVRHRPRRRTVTDVPRRHRRGPRAAARLPRHRAPALRRPAQRSQRARRGEPALAVPALRQSLHPRDPARRPGRRSRRPVRQVPGRGAHLARGVAQLLLLQPEASYSGGHAGLGTRAAAGARVRPAARALQR